MKNSVLWDVTPYNLLGSIPSQVMCMVDRFHQLLQIH
jgi:hypothetical protein